MRLQAITRAKEPDLRLYYYSYGAPPALSYLALTHLPILVTPPGAEMGKRPCAARDSRPPPPYSPWFTILTMLPDMFEKHAKTIK